ncbi:MULTISPECIES: hypothetical protein [Haloferax]|uniref:Lipoprotein n=1 Tax=Haloferax marinum TaxID=2666143 RepID=A0A6A8G5G0_9EURY|nr:MULTISPECIES: hypothetical protein [Haloferax]KAB1197300.1 hypothetical protein Hfx1150_07150 [Haloferax sp. CBA1150]MRW96341.1 hypothetical protein [Haloferax marinum]
MKLTDAGLSRRELLAGMGTATLGILAGCQGQGPTFDGHSTTDDGPDARYDISPDGENRLSLSNSGDDELKPVDKFRVAIFNAGSADGTYPLSTVTDDETFDVGDSYTLGQETLGLDEPLDYADAVIYLDFDSDIGWRSVTGVKFGSAMTADDPADELGGDVRFDISPSNDGQLVVTYERGTESFPLSKLRVVLFDAGDADGTYPLAGVTDEESFDVGDSYTLGQETLGVEDLLTYDDAVIRLEAKGRWRWEFVTAIQFGSGNGAPEQTEGFGRDVVFDVPPAGPHQLTVEYKKGEESLPVSKFRVKISNAGGADGTYPLGDLTDDESFDVGDLYPLDQETLGLDEPLTYDGATIRLEFEFESGWKRVTTVEFGGEPTEGFGRDVVFVAVPAAQNQLDVVYDEGTESLPVSKFRVRITDAGSADGTYRLDDVTDDETFDVGDSYPLTEETLGLDEPLDYQQSTVDIEYQFESGWKLVSKNRFSGQSGDESESTRPRREFDIPPVGPNRLAVEYNSGDSSVPVSALRVTISNAGGADGTYPLGDLTDDESFDVGDSYPLDQGTLGLDEPFDYQDAEILLEQKSESGWRLVGGVRFGDSM